MPRKDPAKKIDSIQEQIKKLQEQLKEQERKRDEELGKIFREEWGIEDLETAQLIISELKPKVETLLNQSEVEEVQSEQSNFSEHRETVHQ
ncbi:hypothetical protein ACU3L3_14480 [Priestia endophytica]|uniref:Uncharacterized protein n=1 Tax=Priestia endophytica DSM 13796 TaxID=1121089 RepID=A0A1I6C7A0_9BACI|nr:hypothetical protein [Priestia endophytica]KYG33495.1 hypothetical protein AZF06_21875 [Priestia endophytica]SFQ89066.1 hypothetical protein SAMN02745910_05189 [Priestia endophytica DSM 13796]